MKQALRSGEKSAISQLTVSCQTASLLQAIHGFAIPLRMPVCIYCAVDLPDL